MTELWSQEEYQSPRRARERIVKLQAVTEALSDARLPADVARVVARQMAAVLAADQGIVAVPSSECAELIILEQTGLGPASQTELARFPISAQLPLAEAFRTAKPVWLSSRDDYTMRFPGGLSTEALSTVPRACVPLIARGNKLGVVGFSFSRPHTFDADEQALIQDLARRAALAFERTRLYETESAARRQAELLFHLAQSTASAEGLDDTYQRVLAGVVEVMDVDRAAFCLFDDDGVMRFKAWRGLSTRYRRTVEGQTPWSRDETNPLPIFVNDAREDPSLARCVPVFEKEGIRALGFVPIVHERKLLGKFMVYCNEPRVFTENDRKLSLVLASHIAQAVARARLVERERLAARRLEIVANASKRVSQAGLDEGAIANAVVTELGKAFGCTVAFLMLSEDRGAGECVGFYHPDSEARHSFQGAWGERRPIIGNDLLASVAATGKSALIKSVNSLEQAQRSFPGDRRFLERFPVYSLLCVPVRAEGGVISAVQAGRVQPGGPWTANDLVLFEDLASRAAIAIGKARLFKQAQLANRAREDMVAIVSHELRNPLAAIVMSSASALKLELNDQKGNLRKKLATIYRSAEQMSRLIEDLVNLASIQSGRLTIQRAVFDAKSVVEAAADEFNSIAEERGIRLETIATSEVGLLEGDRARLIQALANLLSNAVNVTAKGGAVHLGVERRGAEIVYFVRDAGPGIQTDELPHIFEKYWRSKRTTYRGTGLGLAITKGIADAHRGRIWAESSLGAGSTFFVALPAQPNATR